MLANSDSVLNGGYFAGLMPDPIRSVSEWSEANRVLSRRGSAEPGKFRLSRTPYLREIMDCLSSSSPIEEVVVIKGAQLGITESGNNWIGYTIEQAPGMFLYLLPTTLLARRNARQRIDPLIQSTPSLRARVLDKSSGESKSNMFEKEFPGGGLIISGGNSGSSYRSTPAPYVFLDDLDGFPSEIGDEGSPVALARARSRTFPRKKRFFVSTPTDEETSMISPLYEESDKRRFFLPCPHCKELQELKWSQIQWDDKNPETVRYACLHCAKPIYEHQKTWMMENGQWIATNPDPKNKRTAGFHLSSLYSPVGWYSWKDAVKDWLEAQKNVTLLKAFVNTVLGETWKTDGSQPDWKKIYDRRELYQRNTMPEDVLMLVAGADVQADRIEVEIVGVTRNLRTYSIDYRVFPGSLNTEAPWKGLDELLQERFQLKNGLDIPIKLLAVDSGYETQKVYNFCRRYPMNRVIATKGVDQLSMPISQPKAVDVTIKGKTISKGFKYWPIGVSLLKGELYSLLKLEKPVDGEEYPSGYCHFPMYDEEFFKQLTAEKLITKTIRGFPKHEWTLTRARNEALDCRIMCMAALNAIGVYRYQDQHWSALELELRLRD